MKVSECDTKTLESLLGKYRKYVFAIERELKKRGLLELEKKIVKEEKLTQSITVTRPTENQLVFSDDELKQESEKEIQKNKDKEESQELESVSQLIRIASGKSKNKK